jgi:hypothetical protein
MPRRRGIRGNHTPSQAVISARMRELWIDGFGLLPTPFTVVQLDRTRKALADLVNDDLYWKSLTELSIQKQKVQRLIEQLKAPALARGRRTRATNKA